MRQGYCKYMLLCLLLSCSQQIQSREASHASVKDLQYGEMLFYYYQQDYFNSIVRLEIAREQGRLPNHKDEAELMLGGLVLSYGMRNTARDIFQNLLDDDQHDLSVHNRAWLYLAKISYQRGDLPGASNAIVKINGEMTPATRTATANLHSLLLIEKGRNAAAIDILKNTRSGKHWAPYLKYNLGIAQIRNGELQAGLDTLESVSKTGGDTPAQRLLRDKANLALGYSHLEQGETTASSQALEQVRIAGPLSNKALLGAGWANAEAGAYAQALIPWTELASRNVTDPAVQEALIAVPYAMAKMELYGQAIQHYQESITALNDEKRQLDISINAIQNGELLKQLQQSDPGTGFGWIQQLDLDSPVLHYQTELMASHGFQEAVKNYRDLLFLRNNLDNWAHSVTTYDAMLTARQSRYQSQLPAAQQALDSNAFATLQQRKAALADTIASIESSENSMWQKKQQLSEIETLLQQTGKAIGKLQQADTVTPAGFSAFNQEISHRKTDIKQLQTRASRITQAQEILLEQLAVDELVAQQARIEHYIIQARLALAQIYDSSLNNPAKRIIQ
ncbi:MAG TPA: hypothetical protein DCO71_08765 [Gammaproteobacteria bacterium]|nr:hypothetical protein [Gammaproteobacteria bacterium]